MDTESVAIITALAVAVSGCMEVMRFLVGKWVAERRGGTQRCLFSEEVLGRYEEPMGKISAIHEVVERTDNDGLPHVYTPRTWGELFKEMVTELRLLREGQTEVKNLLKNIRSDRSRT